MTFSLSLSVAAHAEHYLTPDLWTAWQAAPDTHPNVPNISYAGVGHGEKPLPKLDVVVKASDFGAQGDGKADDTQAIRKALAAAAERGGGAVLLDAGRYRITQPIFLRYDRVVLRGSGTERTEIYADASLQSGYGKNMSHGRSVWSWAGGMIWFAPIERRTDKFPGEDQWREGWLETESISKIREAAARGDRVITVDDANRFKAGDRVILRLHDSGDFSLYQAMSGDVTGARDYPWATKAAGVVKSGTWHWPVEIESVDGDRLTLRQPLRLRIEMKWKPTLTTTGPMVTGAGVEDLTIRMKPARLSPHLMNPGYNGIYFENAWDCWARNVVIIDTDNGIGTAASKCITVDRFRIEGRRCHHATYTRTESHDVLWTRFEVKAPCHHGLNVEGLSTGNVWSAGHMHHGTLDSHRALPFENVRTDLTIHNDGGHGGGPTAGPLFGARFVHWNLHVTNNRSHMVHCADMMPRGAVVGIRGTDPMNKPYPDFKGPLETITEANHQHVRPIDLHLAQLQHRLGRVPHHLGRDIALSILRADGESLVLDWIEPFVFDRSYRIARRIDDGAWDENYAESVGPRFVDKDVKAGLTYSYRVRPIIPEVDLPWSHVQTMLNRPPQVNNLNWHQTLDPRAVILEWERTPEQAGEIRVQRKPLDADADTWEDLTRLPIDQTRFVDQSVTPGQRYSYRLTVVNPSGESDPIELETYTRASGTRQLSEYFTRDLTAALPASSEGKHTLGTWQWTGTDRDRRPSLDASQNAPHHADDATGTLAWPYTPNQARSFVWCEGIKINLADLGAEVAYDYTIGRSGISTHILSLCLQLDGKHWITSQPEHTEQLMNWYRKNLLIADLNWRHFDPEKLELGKAIDQPDLSAVTAIGFYIDRPINMRYIQFDNLTIWGK